jgi:hypothetical protein
MSVRQLSVFVENKTGHLAAALGTLAEGGVNVLSFTIADTTDYGILRLIVDQVDLAKELLGKGDYAVVEHRVVCALVPNEPGVLAEIARLIAESSIDIDYIYLGTGDSLLLKAEEYGELEALLVSRGFRVLRAEEPA